MSTTTTTTTTTTSQDVDDDPKTTTTTTAKIIPPCLDESDCQENAGCFADELNFDPLSFEINTICHCFLGFYLDNTTAEFPRTGVCIDRRTTPCHNEEQTNCIEDDQGLGICPYCKVRLKYHYMVKYADLIKSYAYGKFSTEATFLTSGKELL